MTVAEDEGSESDELEIPYELNFSDEERDNRRRKKEQKRIRKRKKTREKARQRSRPQHLLDTSDSSSSSSSEDSAGYQSPGRECREPLRAKDVIAYTCPIFIAGSEQGRRQATVLSVNPQEKIFPLVLDNAEQLPWDTRIQRVGEWYKGKLLPHPGCTRPISCFKLKASNNNITVGDALQAQARKLRQATRVIESEALQAAYGKNKNGKKDSDTKKNSAVDEIDDFKISSTVSRRPSSRQLKNNSKPINERSKILRQLSRAPQTVSSPSSIHKPLQLDSSSSDDIDSDDSSVVPVVATQPHQRRSWPTTGKIAPHPYRHGGAHQNHKKSGDFIGQSDDDEDDDDFLLTQNIPFYTKTPPRVTTNYPKRTYTSESSSTGLSFRKHNNHASPLESSEVTTTGRGASRSDESPSLARRSNQGKAVGLVDVTTRQKPTAKASSRVNLSRISTKNDACEIDKRKRVHRGEHKDTPIDLDASDDSEDSDSVLAPKFRLIATPRTATKQSQKTNLPSSNGSMMEHDRVSIARPKPQERTPDQPFKAPKNDSVTSATSSVQRESTKYFEDSADEDEAFLEKVRPKACLQAGTTTLPPTSFDRAPPLSASSNTTVSDSVNDAAICMLQLRTKGGTKETQASPTSSPASSLKVRSDIGKNDAHSRLSSHHASQSPKSRSKSNYRGAPKAYSFSDQEEQDDDSLPQPVFRKGSSRPNSIKSTSTPTPSSCMDVEEPDEFAGFDDSSMDSIQSYSLAQPFQGGKENGTSSKSKLQFYRRRKTTQETKNSKTKSGKKSSLRPKPLTLECPRSRPTPQKRQSTGQKTPAARLDPLRPNNKVSEDTKRRRRRVISRLSDSESSVELCPSPVFGSKSNKTPTSRKGHVESLGKISMQETVKSRSAKKNSLGSDSDGDLLNSFMGSKRRKMDEWLRSPARAVDSEIDSPRSSSSKPRRRKRKYLKTQKQHRSRSFAPSIKDSRSVFDFVDETIVKCKSDAAITFGTTTSHFVDGRDRHYDSRKQQARLSSPHTGMSSMK